MLNYIWAFMILLGIIFAALTGQMSQVTNAALDSAGEAISLCITMAGIMALWMGLMEIAQKAGIIEKMTKGISPFLNFMFPRIPREHPARGYIATNIIANVLGLGWACTPAGLKAMEALAKLEAERGNPEYQEGEQGSKEHRGEKRGNPDYLEGEQRKKEYRGAERGRPDHPLRERETETREQGGNKLSPATLSVTGNRAASSEMCTFLILNISSLQLIPVNMIAYRSQYGSASPAGIIAPAIVATLFSTLVAIVYCKLKDRKG